MRKRLLTISLATALCLAGFTACGNTDTQQETTAETEQEAEESTAENVENTEEADNSTEGTEADAGDDKTEEASADGKTLDTTLWSLSYDDSVWTYEEDDLRDDEQNSTIELSIPDGDDGSLVTAEIRANITTPYSFRDDLYTYGIDEKAYVEGTNPEERVTIGGVELMKYEGSYWGSDSVRYFNRLESANETISVRIVGDVENAAVQELIDGITFNVTDVGNEDGPWYWEGEPFDVGDLSATVGSATINTSFLKMEEPYITHETFNQRICTVDSKMYILLDDNLRVYNIGDGTLTFDTEYTLDNKYSTLMSTTDGRIFMSGFSKGLIEWKDGEVVNSYSGSEIKYVEVAPDGSFGISYFTSGSDCYKITFSDGSYTAEPLAFKEIDTIQHMNVNNNHIFVCGSSAEGEDGHQVVVYDTNGNMELNLKEEGENIGLGSVTYVFETDSYYVGMDGNMRTIPVWSKDGTYQGRVEDSDLFGTGYPWFCGSTVAADGTCYTVITDERPDKSADEVLVFKMSGF